jgi:hypothetical protein
MPATIEDKQITELNKSVQRIVKVLETAVGNTATQKAKKSEEEILAELRMETAEKEAKVVEKQEKSTEAQKVKFFDVASFMKASAAEYFESTKQDKLTWGNFFTSLKEGYKKWFKEASQQRTALGLTLRLGASLWRNTQKHILDNVRRLWNSLTGHIQEVLGELGGVLSFVKDTFMSAFNFVKDTFMGMFRKVPPHDKKRNKLLQAIVGYLRRDEKRDLLQKSDGSRRSILGMLALLAAAAIGAIIGKFLLPFKTVFGGLMKTMKVAPILKTVGAFFTKKFPILGKLFKSLGGIFSKSGPLGRLFTFVTTKIPFFSSIFKFLKFGFTKLAWPLQIIMSVIDFIKGFQQTEGNLADKVIGGIKNALFKFFELPVKIIGWIVEKVLGLFGVEVDGVAGKIMDFLKSWWDTIFSLFRPIIGLIEGFFTTEGSIADKFKGALAGFFNGIRDMIAAISNFFLPMVDPIQKTFSAFFDSMGGLLDIITEWSGKIGKIVTGIINWFKDDEEDEEDDDNLDINGNPYPSRIKTEKQKRGHDLYLKRQNARKNKASTQGTGVKDAANAQAKRDAQAQQAQTDELKKTLDENTKKQIDEQKKLAEKQDAATALALGGNAQSAPAEIPAEALADEIEIFGLLAGNNSF